VSQLDDLARELYAGPPGEFVAIRDERARLAKEAGDQQFARELRALRRPTQGAWVVNLLVARRRKLVDELLAVGAEFRGERLTRQRIQELSGRRRQLLHRLLADAHELAEEAGVRLSADLNREVEATLHAAVADEESAAAVHSGRLVKTLSYSGFGPELLLAPVEPDADESAGRHASDEPGAGGRAGAADSRGTTAAGTTAAERLMRAAGEALDAATTRRDELTGRRAELRAELDRVRRDLDRVRGELAETEHALTAAERAIAKETNNVDRARRDLDRARSRTS
jgi:hypothetical protein